MRLESDVTLGHRAEAGILFELALGDQFLEFIARGVVRGDLDAVVIRQARLAGEPVFYGDCTHRTILEHAGLPHARAMVITFDEMGSVSRTLAAVQAVHPEADVLVRTRDDRH